MERENADTEYEDELKQRKRRKDKGSEKASWQKKKGPAGGTKEEEIKKRKAVWIMGFQFIFNEMIWEAVFPVCV